MMRLWQSPVVLRVGLTALVLVSTGVCAVLGSVQLWLGLVVAAGCTFAGVLAGWPVLNRGIGAALAAAYAQNCFEAIAANESVPDPPPQNTDAARLSEASRAVVDCLTSAQNQLAQFEAQAAQEMAELDESRRAATTAREEAACQAEQIREREQRIERLMGAISDAAMGDLTKRLSIEGDDSLASLGMAVNEMIAGLARLVDQLRHAAQQVAKSTTEIQGAVAQQSSGASEQAASIAQVTATGEELATSAKQIAQHAQSVVAAAERAQQTVQSAESAIQSASEGMQKIETASERTGKTIAGLNERAQKIGNIIGIIVDIADQTKLLSLNAAIEAARAGEAGKGFAVVATEIRNLANSVTESTKEIQELLTEIQGSAEQCVAVSREDAARVSEGTSMIQSIADALGHIEATISDNTQLARKIDVSTRQQQSASEQVATAMREIAQVAQQSAAASQQVGAAVSELLELARNLESTVGSIKTSVA